MIRWIAACLSGLLFAACVPQPPVDPLAGLRQPDGSVIWQNEFAFVPPAEPWQLVSLDEDDYSIAFVRECREIFPCQSTLAYAEEPFGYSKDLLQRQEEFFKRYLWASRVVFDKPVIEMTTWGGKTALVAEIKGVEPVKGQKVWSKVLFAYRGERVVGFYFNQWRPSEAAFDPEDGKEFDRFVETFGYLKPSFYETL